MWGTLGPAPYIIAIIVAIGIVALPVVIIFRLAIGFIKGDKNGKSKLDEIYPDSKEDTEQGDSSI